MTAQKNNYDSEPGKGPLNPGTEFLENQARPDNEIGANKDTTETPTTLEELKTLLKMESLPESQKERDWLLKSTQEMVKRKGEDWVKKNRVALLRQWEYVRTLL